MLKLLEQPSAQVIEHLLPASHDDLYMIYALLPLLDVPSLAEVWIQTHEENRPTAVLTKTRSGFLRIAAEKNADFEELRAFLKTYGSICIQTSPAVLAKLVVPPQTKYRLMALETETAPTRAASYVYDGFRPLYDLIVSTLPAPPDALPAAVQENLYNEWLSRTVRGVFHGYTRVTAAYAKSSDLAATAFADVLGGYAYLREVACAPAYRKQGYASSCVRTLYGDLKKDGIRRIFLSCAPEKEEFYQKSGFRKHADLEVGFLTP